MLYDTIRNAVCAVIVRDEALLMQKKSAVDNLVPLLQGGCPSYLGVIN
jgi:hypothetical protein